MAAKKSWLIVGGLSTFQLGPLHRLLECPQDVAVEVPQSGQGVREQGRVAVPLMTWFQKSHTVSSTPFSLLEVSY